MAAAAATKLDKSDDLEQLRYQSRAVSPWVWQPAVCALVEASGRSPRAYKLLRELLLSEEAELRYRGVIGLQEAARVDGEALVRFVKDRWEEPATQRDPVFLEALAQSCQRLQPELLEGLVGEVWRHGPEALRSSTLTLLWKVATQRGVEALQPALRDPSPLIRSYLAMLAVEEIQLPMAMQALTQLAEDAEPEVRAAVAAGLIALRNSPPEVRGDLMESPHYQQLCKTLEKDAVPEIRLIIKPKPTREAPAAPRSATSSALELASELDRKPAQCLQRLTPWLGTPTSNQRLKAVAEFSCHPEVGQAARALAALCDEGLAFRERLLRCIGSLHDIRESNALVELKALASLCLHLVDLDSRQALSQFDAAQLGILPHSQFKTRELLEAVPLAQQACKHEEDVAAAVDALEILRERSSTGPLPERELIEPVLVHLMELLLLEV